MTAIWDSEFLRLLHQPYILSNCLCSSSHWVGFVLQDSSEDGIQRAVSQGEPHDPGLPAHVVLGQSFTPQGLPQMVFTLQISPVICLVESS